MKFCFSSGSVILFNICIKSFFRSFSVIGFLELLKIIFLSFDNRSSIILSSIESFWRLEIVVISIFGLEL
ncbi:MAG: hypothetical protein ACP5RD_06310 [bacterium]